LKDQAAWNTETAASVDREVKDWLSGDLLCNAEFSYTVVPVAAMEGFLATRTDVVWMGNGHYESVFESENRLLASGKNLTPEDLFDPATPWQEGLAEIAAQKMQAEARYPFAASAIVDQIDSTASWDVAADRLTVHVDFYQMSGGWSGAGSAEIPWRELKPYLRPDLPIALKLD
jgi:hypothetical protein